MTDPMPSGMSGPAPTSAQAAPAKKRGCFFYGCLTVIILLVLGAGAAYFGVKYLYHVAIDKFTTTSSLSIPPAAATQSDFETTFKRLTEFKTAMDLGKGPETLSLSANDINALLAFSPKANFLKDHAVVDIKGDQAYAKFSVPLDTFGMAGRFLNGEGSFKVSLLDGKLHLDPSAVVLNGQSVPAEILSSFSKQDAAVDMFKDPESKNFFAKLKSLKIENNAVIVTRR
jgi:hypothetical protein